MFDKRVSMAVGAILVGSIAVVGVQSQASEKGQSVKQETGTATVQSDSGEIELVSASSGVAVSRVSGAIERANVFRTGDIITSVDGRRVATPENLLGHVRQNPETKAFEITFVRDGQKITKSVESKFLTSFMTPQPPEPPPLPSR